jgi:hypothetical protein
MFRWTCNHNKFKRGIKINREDKGLMQILINIVFFFIILGGGISGYFSGFRKSIWRLIFFLGTILFCIVLSNLFASWFYNLNYSNFNIRVMNLRLRTIPGLIKSLIAIYFPDTTPYLDEAYFLNYFIKEIGLGVLRIFFYIFWMIILTPLTDLFFLIYKKRKPKVSNHHKDSLFGMGLGLLQSFFFILFLSSPFHGLVEVVSDIGIEGNNLIKEYSSSIPNRVSGNFVFDRLFNTRYKGKNIIFRKDIKAISEIFREDIKTEVILDKMQYLESVEILGPIILEMYLNSKNVILDEDKIKEIEEISYQKEVSHLSKAYQDFLSIDLNNLLNQDPLIIKRMTESLSNCSFLNVIGLYLFDDILPFLDKYIIFPKEIIIDYVVWTEEIFLLGEIYTIFYDLGYNDIYSLNFRNDEEETSELFRLLFSSKIFTKNIEEIKNIILSKLPRELTIFKIERIDEAELTNILCFVGFLNDNGFFKEDFVWTKFLTDKNISKLVDYLTSSDILIRNLDAILPLMYSKSSISIESIIIPEDIDWQSESGKAELKCFFELLRIFNSNIKYQNQVLKYTESFISKKEISSLVSLNTEQIINYLINRFFGKDFEYIDSGAPWTGSEGQAEFMKILEIYKEFVESGLLYTKSLKNLDEKQLSSLAKSFSESKTFVLNTNAILENMFDRFDLPFSLALYEDTSNLVETDYLKLLKAGKILEGIVSEDDIFALSLDDFEVVISSDNIFRSLKNFLYDLSQEKVEDGEVIKPYLTVNLEDDDPNWYEEMKNFFIGIKLILAKNEESGLKKLDLNIIKNITTGYKDEEEDDLSKIIASRILKDTIIYKIESIERDPNTGKGVLIIDIYEENWLDGPPPYYRAGEIRNLIRGLQILYRETGIDLNDPEIHRDRLIKISDGTEDTNGDGFIDEQDENLLEEILKSKIISDTIIFLLFEEIGS